MADKGYCNIFTMPVLTIPAKTKPNPQVQLTIPEDLTWSQKICAPFLLVVEPSANILQINESLT